MKRKMIYTLYVKNDLMENETALLRFRNYEDAVKEMKKLVKQNAYEVSIGYENLHTEYFVCWG